jgi:hypothetical protein
MSPLPRHIIREELHGILIFIGVIWAVFLLSIAIPSLDSFGGSVARPEPQRRA